MSKPALLTILALAIASAIYFATLAFWNGKIADESLRRELQKPDCVSPDRARAVRASCVKIERKKDLHADANVGLHTSQ